MRYIKVENNQITNYSIGQLFTDHPNAVIFKLSNMPNEDLLANYNVYPLITTTAPTTADGMTAVEGTPEFKNGEWYQTWNVRELTEEEIQKIIETYAADEIVFSNTLPATGIQFFANLETQQSRYAICNSCPSFTALKLCKECGCIMPLKVKLSNATCPIGKW
jgi:hypothetical protein